MPEPNDVSLDRLLEHIKRARGFDFTGYKRSTLERRLRKRMASINVHDYAAYLDVLEVRHEEFAALFNTILINVTSFFRDPEAWETLRTHVLPRLLESRSADVPVRVWSAGCASGEEPYSLAILLAEAVGLDALPQRAKIYATDADHEALQQARRTTYAEADVASLPAGFLEKYFDKVDDRFLLKKEIRRCVIFGPHDLVQDPPISRIDLLTCRNTLMYMNSETQEHILRRLHFALSESGVVMLGKAEMLLAHSDMFSPIDLQQRIFAKVPKELTSRGPIRVVRAEPPASFTSESRLRDSAFDASPLAQLVIGVDGHLSLASGRTGEVFGLGAGDVGKPFQDLEISYRPVELRSVIENAYAEHRTIVLKDVERMRAGEVSYYDVHVTPLADRAGARLGAHITFLDITRTVLLQQQLRRANGALEAAFGELQSTSEELETTNEELHSTVEELETTNEELHSTNEDLETMNEELHSANVELQTLNHELQVRGAELVDANAFLESILATFHGAVMVVDRELHVQRWNSRAQETWHLKAEQLLGKTLLEASDGVPVDALVGLIRECFSMGVACDGKVEWRDGDSRRLGVATCSPIGHGPDVRGAVILVEGDVGAHHGKATGSEARQRG